MTREEAGKRGGLVIMLVRENGRGEGGNGAGCWGKTPSCSGGGFKKKGEKDAISGVLITELHRESGGGEGGILKPWKSRGAK